MVRNVVKRFVNNILHCTTYCTVKCTVNCIVIVFYNTPLPAYLLLYSELWALLYIKMYTVTQVAQGTGFISKEKQPSCLIFIVTKTVDYTVL